MMIGSISFSGYPIPVAKPSVNKAAQIQFGDNTKGTPTWDVLWENYEKAISAFKTNSTISNDGGLFGFVGETAYQPSVKLKPNEIVDYKGFNNVMHESTLTKNRLKEDILDFGNFDKDPTWTIYHQDGRIEKSGEKTPTQGNSQEFYSKAKDLIAGVLKSLREKSIEVPQTIVKALEALANYTPPEAA